ncbi:alcohol dehydrogenase [Stenotrophomonas panacihumi]|uniref:Alcohol dehydrogenase n=1 Tax=Stenotrophomonas panacihumi TaxID=676599 RepID=A0A0R0ANX1_9GAMM|nr:cytochrome c [Stenotrophomonas panacihumi]KRG43310.1 alcohol dehydrogenase [Stenotrophomonas panacihumi]PTN55628.1 cytochrome c [Stenotrophomonas panacihumi]
MKKFLIAVLLLAVLVLAIALAWAFWPSHTRAIADATPSGAQNAADPALIAQGQYLATAGDCFACHSRPGGKPFAGGLPIASPIGTIYSSNITPDPETGIGRYSLDDFDRALRHGIAADGSTLYPAMPYPSYARLSDDDVRALYAYFQHGVQPVREANHPTGIHWPLSMRWPLAIWRKTFAPDPDQVAFDAKRYPDPQIARGAYLVQGLGHCGACHTPRAFSLQEQALDESGAAYLSGGQVIDGWDAVSLRADEGDGLGLWSTQDIVDTLKTARNPHAAVVGQPMADVVVHSTQHLRDEDLQAIAAYLKSLPVHGGRGSTYAQDDATAKAMTSGINDGRGAELFADNCAACHRSDARGNPHAFPSLAGNPTVLAPDASSLVRLVLAGGSLPSTQTRPSNLGMPAFAWRLSDEEVATLATWLRSQYGNQAPAVAATQVRKIRDSLEEVPRDAKATAQHDPTSADASDQ